MRRRGFVMAVMGCAAFGLAGYALLALWQRNLGRQFPGFLAAPAEIARTEPTAAGAGERPGPPATEGSLSDEVHARAAAFAREQRLSATREREAEKFRAACVGWLASRLGPAGIEVWWRSDVLSMKGKEADGRLAEALDRAGLIEQLGSICRFRSITLMDGRYFSATWPVPFDGPVRREVAIVADRQRMEARQRSSDAFARILRQ